MELTQNKTIGARLKFLRDNKTLKVIADYLGVSIANYYKYENDMLNISWKNLKLIAEYYNISLDELTKGL
jgi:transcriptional regulator with XRE-family HTH domain